MGRSLIFTGNMSMRISHLPKSSSLLPLQNPFSYRTVTRNLRHGCSRILSNRFNSTTRLQTKAVLSKVTDQTRYPRIGAKSTGTISPAHLLQVVEAAAKTGAEVRNFISFYPIFCLFTDLKNKILMSFEILFLGRNKNPNLKCSCSLILLVLCWQVVMEAVNKPRNITYKGLTDLVTE